jgi:hypothetical protein
MRPLTAIVLLVGAAASAFAQGGPAEVHHIHGLALARKDPKTVYVATHTGLVRVRPGGEPEWVGGHRFDLMGFTAHPSEPNLMFASGHPDLPTFRRDGVGNLGLLASRDGGRTWQSLALRGEADFHALAYTPRNGGELYGWNVAGEPGLYRISTNTWTVQRLRSAGLSDVLALAASPEPDGPLFAGTRRGLRVSRDGGKTWLPAGALPADIAVTALAVRATAPEAVYAYVLRQDLGLMWSRDGGSSWERTGYQPGQAAPVIAVALGPGGEIAVATTAADVLRSEDGGRSWTALLRGGQAAGGR